MLTLISFSFFNFSSLSLEEGSQQTWLCGEFFSIADVSLAVTLHRLKFLGLSRRYWGNGTRVNLETYYERVLNRPTFRRVLGQVNNILISAVLPTAFRVAKKKAPAFVGATLLIGLIGGATYLAFNYIKKRLLVSWDVYWDSFNIALSWPVYVYCHIWLIYTVTVWWLLHKKHFSSIIWSKAFWKTVTCSLNWLTQRQFLLQVHHGQYVFYAKMSV